MINRDAPEALRPSEYIQTFGRNGISLPDAITTGGTWPEPRPLPWRAIAVADRWFRFSRIFGDSADVVLLYHSVGGVSGVDYRWDISATTFREQIQLLDQRYELVSLETLATEISPDEKRVALTFDDGFANVYETAAPILREFDVPATVFVCADFLDPAGDSRIGAHHDLGNSGTGSFMTADQLRKLADEARFTIGNHTFSHRNLTKLEQLADVEQEIVSGKEVLEDRLGVTVNQFSYPYGGVDERARDVVSQTHDIAVTSEQTHFREDVHPLSIPRIDACQPVSILGFEVTDAADRIRSSIRSITR